MINVLIIDNYDSFTYNLVHYFEELDCNVTVYRNDELDLIDVQPFHKIVLSPGPGLPDQAGLLKAIIAAYAPTKSILGVCLGQQAIAEVFGGSLINLESVYHGVSSKVTILEKNDPIFIGLPSEIEVGRYHSWVVNRSNFPDCLSITSVDGQDQIMSLRHKSLNVYAVQFHPESILTPFGKQLLRNWINS